MKIPCKDCITFSLCKNQAEYHSFLDPIILIKKCKLFNSWFWSHSFDDTYIEISKVFKMDPIDYGQRKNPL
jgi:hypothetical protein